ncbi:TMEM175 family protein [Bifidobacterium aquikefiricola]|uniref:TMEM175 family protein n=1 Tax=Bifidobacterium aquikefiricola TaxID=3059038 RepID=A0AB39U459_9BIFI
MKKFKERFDVFSDAVFAIILTIMVLDVPVEVLNGELNYMELAQNIGIYVVSFCFVANCWYKHALMFNEVDKVPHTVIILDFLLLLSVSLIPAFTKLMISDIAQGTVMLCGTAYLIVTILEVVIARAILPAKYQDAAQMKQVYTYIFGSAYLTNSALLVVFIALAYFRPYFGLVLFIIIPIRSFISNAGKQQNFNDISQLDSQGVSSFMKLSQSDKRRFLMILRRYIGQMRSPNLSRDDKNAAWTRFVNDVQRSFGISEEQASQWFHDATLEHKSYRDSQTQHETMAQRPYDRGTLQHGMPLPRHGRRNRQQRGRRH